MMSYTGVEYLLDKRGTSPSIDKPLLRALFTIEGEKNEEDWLI